MIFGVALSVEDTQALGPAEKEGQAPQCSSYLVVSLPTTSTIQKAFLLFKQL